MAFFDQKHGLSPLEKCDYLDFEKFCFLFWPNLNKRKRGIFGLKAWVNAFGKVQFFGLWKIIFFKVKKGFFFLWKSESITSSLILIKCKLKKIACLGQKHGLNPSEKNSIFWTFKNSVFYSKRGLFFLWKVTKHYFKSHFH